MQPWRKKEKTKQLHNSQHYWIELCNILERASSILTEGKTKKKKKKVNSLSAKLLTPRSIESLLFILLFSPFHPRKRFSNSPRHIVTRTRAYVETLTRQKRLSGIYCGLDRPRHCQCYAHTYTRPYTRVYYSHTQRINPPLRAPSLWFTRFPS